MKQNIDKILSKEGAAEIGQESSEHEKNKLPKKPKIEMVGNIRVENFSTYSREQIKSIVSFARVKREKEGGFVHSVKIFDPQEGDKNGVGSAPGECQVFSGDRTASPEFTVNIDVELGFAPEENK